MGYDADSLGRELTPAERHEIDRRAAAGEFGSTSSILKWALTGIGMALLMCVGLFLWRPLLGGSHPRSGFFGVAVAAAPVIAIVGIVVHAVLQFRREAVWRNLAWFAVRNGLRFDRESGRPDLPGAVFGVGSSRYTTHRLTGPGRPFLDAGTYHWTTGSGDNSHDHTVNYVAYQLPHPVPHLALRTRSTNSVLERHFDRSQVLAMGGDFDRRYRLYAVEGQGRDAYQVFTPAVMAALVEHPLLSDVEFIGDRVILYGHRELDAGQPQTWQRLAFFEDQVLARVARTASGLSTAQPGAGADARPPFGQQTPPPLPPMRLRSRGPGLFLAVLIALPTVGFLVMALSLWLMMR